MRSTHKLGFFVVAQALGATAVVPLALADLPSGTLLQNGSFEQPAIGGPSQFGTIPGWSPTAQCSGGGDIEIDNGEFGAAADGNRSVELSSTCVNGISQTVATTPGASYALTLAFGARPGTTAQQNQMSVSFGGQVLDNLILAPDGSPNINWTLHEYNVTASGTSAQLVLQRTDPDPTDSLGTEVDFVSLVPLVVNATPMQTIPGAYADAWLACPSPGQCVAVGIDETFSSALVTVITNGTAGPTQVYPGIIVTGLACSSPTSCVAFGSSDGESAIMTLDGGVLGPPQLVPETSEVRSVACSSPTSCVAVCNDGVVVPIESGVAGPAEVVPGVDEFSDVACDPAGTCFATAEGPAGGGVVPIRGGVAGPAQFFSGVLTVDITCPAAGSCVATAWDVSTARSYIVAVTNGVAGSPQIIGNTTAVFGSVACSDASHCVAVGNSNTATGGGFVVAVDDGVPGPIQTVPGVTVFRSVSCTTSCVAVGALNVNGPPEIGAIVPISGGVAGSVQYASGAGYLFGVACGASGCTVVGQDPSVSVGGFLSIQPAATPTLSTTASPSVPQGGEISDSATVSGGSSPTGTVTFTLYGPGDDTCSTPLSTSTVPLVNGTASSGDVQAGAAGTYNWVAAYSGDLANLPATSPCGAEPVAVTPQTLTGRAYGLSADATLLGLTLLDVSPTPDTGDVSTTSSSATSVPCVATLSGLLHANGLCASVDTTGYPGSSTATASVTDVSLSLETIPAVTIGAVEATSTTTCGGSTGTTTIASLKVGGTVVIDAQTSVAPNTKVRVGAVELTLNEQIPSSSPDAGLTVNAIHLHVSALGLARTDLVVASAQSDIGNCP